jgi:hypothetical protein
MQPPRADAPDNSIATAPDARWTHGQEMSDARGPRMPTCVASGVQALRDAGAIGDPEVRAAKRWYEDYVLGVHGVREPSLVQRSGSADAHDVAIARAAAVGRHRDIAELLGPRITAWLVAFVVDDLSLVAMSARYWPGDAGRKEMKGAMCVLLLLLSRLYAALDRRRKNPAG